MCLLATVFFVIIVFEKFIY